MEIRNGIIFFDTKAEFEAYVSDANNVSITNYPVYIGDTKEIITHNVTYKDASEIDASQITSGKISIDRLPAGSLERCVVVANESARFALTTNDVQDGDTVKQSDTGVMYMVVDVNNLNSDAGYLTYTAVTDWESIANKPEFDYVKYSEQELTDEQKQIARENIGVPTKVSELENDKNYLESGSGDGTNLLADDGEYKAIKTLNGESLLGEGNIDVEHLVEVTYEELFEMQCLGKLTPGVKYRIINYKPTILYPGASSNDIGFDIIVKALSKNELDEDAEFILNGVLYVTSEIGTLTFLGCKEKCLEIEIGGGFALFTYIGCYYDPSSLEFSDSEYIFCWRCLNKETSDIVYSFTRHPKKDDIIYAGGGSGGPLPLYTVLTSEKLYHVMYPGTDEFIATDTVFIWSGLEKFTVDQWSVQRGCPTGLEKGIIKYVNPFDNTDVMNRFVVYHDVTLFEDNENVHPYRSLFQWDRGFGYCLGYDNYSDSCFIGSETNPGDFGDLSVGSKHIAWAIGCVPYPVGECIIRGYSFEFSNRGFINYMKTTRGDEANIDFYNTVFEQGPVLYLIADKPNKIINSVYNDPNLQYQNIYEYPEQCFIPIGGGNIIEESSNVNISGHYNIIQYSEDVFFDNAWNNQILHSDNISFNGTNNTNNIINQCSKLTFNNRIYRSMFVHSIDRSFNEMVNDQYVIGKYDLDDFVSDPILNSTF